MSEQIVNAELVKKIATLARLAPEPERLEVFASQMGDILGHMDQLAEVDTKGVEPLYSPSEHGTVYRKDEAASRHSRDEVLSNAPEEDGEFYIVPRIV